MRPSEQTATTFDKSPSGAANPRRKEKIMVTMIDVLRQLEKEVGNEAFEIFEWYCKTYYVTGSDEAPASVRYEVFGY